MDSGRIHIGTFVTLSTCTGTSDRAAELDTHYNGLCENMEGAAAAQVATLHNIPWLEIRGISNIVEDRDLNKWDIPRAAEAAQKAVHRDPRRVGHVRQTLTIGYSPCPNDTFIFYGLIHGKVGVPGSRFANSSRMWKP